MSKHHIQNEKADAGRDGRTRLQRPNSQTQTGTGNVYFPCSADHETGNFTRLIHTLLQILRHARGQGDIIFPVQLTTSRIGNLTRLIHTVLYVMTTHT